MEIAFDRKLFAVHLQKAFAVTISELADATHLSQAELESYESATVDPTGNHPPARACIIVNYDDDLIRQCLTRTHDAGHAILDTQTTFDYTYLWRNADLKEVRANISSHSSSCRPNLQGDFRPHQAWYMEPGSAGIQSLILSPRALALGLEGNRTR